MKLKLVPRLLTLVIEYCDYVSLLQLSKIDQKWHALVRPYLEDKRRTQINELINAINPGLFRWYSLTFTPVMCEEVIKRDKHNPFNMSFVKMKNILPGMSLLTNVLDLQLTCLERPFYMSYELTQMTNLTSLKITDNNIRQIPPGLGQLVNLKHLSLGHNQLQNIPSDIGRLSNLIELNLNHNQIDQLPDTLTQLIHLKKLSLGHNQLTMIPDVIYQLTILTELNLDHNKISCCPFLIARLKNLEILNLSFNQIATIPGTIGYLTKLRKLYLSHNRLLSVPFELTQLSLLKELQLSHNSINTIPPELNNLNAWIYLSHNQIKVTPEMSTWRLRTRADMKSKNFLQKSLKSSLYPNYRIL